MTEETENRSDEKRKYFHRNNKICTCQPYKIYIIILTDKFRVFFLKLEPHSGSSWVGSMGRASACRLKDPGLILVKGMNLDCKLDP